MMHFSSAATFELAV